jgi:hypothetical protein
MSFWKKIFGSGSGSGSGDGNGDGSDPGSGKRPVPSKPPDRPSSLRPSAGDDETVAWVKKRLAELEVPDDEAAIRGRAVGSLDRLLEAKRALAGEPHETMMWGLAVTDEVAPWLFREVPPVVEEMIEGWRAALERDHGQLGRVFFAEMLERSGLPTGGVVTRRGKRHLTFEPEPEGDEALTEAASVIARASAEAHVELTREGGALVAAKIGTQFDGPDPEEILHALVAGTDAATLRDLRLGLWSGEGDANYESAIAVIVERAARLPALRSLFVGDFDFPDESEISWTTVGDASGIWSALPQLRSLRLRGGEIELGDVAHAQLESLVIETGGLPAAAVESLAAARLPALKKLEIWFGDSGYGAEGDIETFGPFFVGRATPAVVDLGLKNAEFSDDLAVALATSPLAPRLERVDLGMGTLSDRGAEALAAAAPRFERLKKLEIDHCYLTSRGQEALRAAFGSRLELGEILEADEDMGDRHYYVSVGE